VTDPAPDPDDPAAEPTLDRSGQNSLGQNSSGARWTAVAFSGSLRAESANLGLVRLAAELAPAALAVEITDLPSELPWYNPDLEESLPDVAVRWREMIGACDVIVIGLPEYNFGPSALAKNAIDWLTRPLGPHALQGKVVALLTAGGKGGGAKAQESVGVVVTAFGNTLVDRKSVV